MTVIIEKHREGVVKKLCDLIKTASDESIADHGAFYLGVSGGSLANFLQEGLPYIAADFSKWRIFFCDERVVPENSADSTFGFYKKNVLPLLGLKEDQFVSIKQGVSADAAAADYSQKMELISNGSLPRFDMLLLGMGPDGHTCSLFPGHALLNEQNVWVASITDSPKPPPERVTMTLSVINNARYCVFAMSGKEKAQMVKRILIDNEDLPAARVKPISGHLYWMLDEAAAEGLH